MRIIFLLRDTKVQLKELVDNALDAFSRINFSPLEGKQVKVVIRKKDNMILISRYLTMDLDGTHTKPQLTNYLDCLILSTLSSILVTQLRRKGSNSKKQAQKADRYGQFAIGLFSFWALGCRLTIYSRSYLGNGKIGLCSKMIWMKEEKEATITHNIEPPNGLSRKAGTLVVIDHLQKSQMNSITGNILCTYLSRACRTVLMKNSDIELIIDDHGIKSTVKPKKYEGSKFKTTRIETEGGFGFVNMEIYANPLVESPEEFQVPIFQKGAKVYSDITEIPELNIYPWNSKKVYGEINYPFGNLSPSRTAFVNDEWLGAFIKAMLKETQEVAQFVDRIEAWKRADKEANLIRFFEIPGDKYSKVYQKIGAEKAFQDPLRLLKRQILLI